MLNILKSKLSKKAIIRSIEHNAEFNAAFLCDLYKLYFTLNYSLI